MNSLKNQMLGNYLIKTLIAEKQCREDISYTRSVHLTTDEFAKYYKSKEVLKLIGSDYLVFCIDRVKQNFNEDYYLKLCTK